MFCDSRHAWSPPTARLKSNSPGSKYGETGGSVVVVVVGAIVVVVGGAVVVGAIVGGAVVVTAVMEVGGVVELVVDGVLEDVGAVLEDAGAVLEEDVVVVSGSEALMVLLVGGKVEDCLLYTSPSPRD